MREKEREVKKVSKTFFLCMHVSFSEVVILFLPRTHFSVFFPYAHQIHNLKNKYPCQRFCQMSAMVLSPLPFPIQFPTQITGHHMEAA